jgi:hypothetical protein
MTPKEVALGTIVIALLAALVAIYVADRNVQAAGRAFSTAGFDGLTERVDKAVTSIGTRLSGEGFEDELNALYAKLAAPPPAPVVRPAGTQDLATVETPAPTPLVMLNLTGIAWKKMDPLAFVNDHVVGVGDMIEGYRVIRIEAERITIRDPKGQLCVLELYGTAPVPFSDTIKGLTR